MRKRDSLAGMGTIGSRIRDVRESKKLTQTQLAKLAGVSQGTIGNSESGLRDRPRELLKIATALGVNPQWLEDGTGSKLIKEAPSKREMPDWVQGLRDTQAKLAMLVHDHCKELSDEQANAICVLVESALQLKESIPKKAKVKA